MFHIGAEVREGTPDNLRTIPVDTVEDAGNMLSFIREQRGVYIIDIDKVLNEAPHVPAMMFLRRTLLNGLGMLLPNRGRIPPRHDDPPQMMALGIDVQKAVNLIRRIRELDPEADIVFATARTSFRNHEHTRRGRLFHAFGRWTHQEALFNYDKILKEAIVAQGETIPGFHPGTEVPTLSIAPNNFSSFVDYCNSVDGPQICIVENVAKNLWERAGLQVIYGARSLLQVRRRMTHKAIARISQMNALPNEKRPVVAIDDKYIPGLKQAAERGHRVIHLLVRGFSQKGMMNVLLK